MRTVFSFRALSSLVLMALLSFPCLGGIRYRDFTVRDGLSESSVKCLTTDSRGRIWMGSWNGISIFDGHSFSYVMSSPLDDQTLTHNVINRMVEHPDGSMWVTTELGINRVDPDTRKCKRFFLGFGGGRPQSGRFVLDISPSGDVFCCSTLRGFALWDPESDRMMPIHVLGPGSGELQALFCGEDGELFIQNASQEVYRMSYQKEENTLQILHTERILGGHSIQYLWKLEDGSLLAVGEGEAFRIGKGGRTDGPIRIPEGSYFSCSLDRSDSTVRLIIDEKQMFSLDFDRLEARPVDLADADNMLAVLVSAQGLWVSIDGIGVRMYFDNGTDFRNLPTSALFDGHGGNMLDIAEGRNHNLVVSSMGNGLASYNYVSGAIHRIESPGLERIFCLQEDGAGNILAGGEHSLFLLSGNGDGRYSVRKLADIGAKIFCITPDPRRQCIWIGTIIGGLFKIDCSGSWGNYRKCVPETVFPEDSDLCRDIMSVLTDADGSLWIGTLGDGIYRYDPSLPEGDNVIRFSTDAGYKITNNDILHMTWSADSTLLAGTGYGLMEIRPQGKNFTINAWTTADGLADNSIHGILEDSQGRIWVATSRGLSRIGRDTREVLNFNSEYVLSTYEFCNHSCLVLSDGRLFFGGIGGGCLFRPEEITTRDFSPEIHFDSFLLRGEALEGFHPENPVNLAYNENYFTIGFNAIEYINNENCEYEYRLLGFEEEWNRAGTGHFATYTNVPTGQYSFQVRSTNGDKAACDNIATLEISIGRPWWKTVWAYLLYALVVAGLGFAILRIMQNRIRRKNEMDRYEAKLDFFTSIAHEFGTPLTLISGSSERLAGIMSGKEPDKYLKIISSNAERMQKLISEVMEFRKIDSGGYKPTFRSGDIRQLLEGILFNFSDINERNRITLHADLPEEAVEVVTDQEAVEKILTNLVSNAYKYTPYMGQISVLLRPEENGFRFRIRNSGKAIQKADLDKVFDRFTILDTLERQSSEGRVRRNGLGMALVKSLTDLLHGSITVDSSPGSHVLFDLFIPGVPEGADLVEIEETEEAERPEKEQLPTDIRPLVLAVDDEASIRKILLEILSADFRIVTAASVAEAREQILHDKPDIILSDINMPGENGLQFLSELKKSELTRNIPFIFIAFRSEADNETRAYELGCDRFLYKPFKPRLLKAIISHLLGSREDLKAYYTSMNSRMDSFNGRLMDVEDKNFMKRFVSIVEENLTVTDLTVDFVADKMAMSKIKLYNKTKELAGKAPGEFIQSIKLDYAANLLKTTRLTILEVLYSSGFNNKSYFYREFKKNFGMTPKDFRARNSGT